jgi:phosphohistidine phosphatase
MLTLSLMRHAKSDWSGPGMDDFDRPLAPRGRDAAPRMGAYMADAGLRPRLILCSEAVRTRQTLDLVLPYMKSAPRVSIERGLYLASSATMIARLRRVEGDVPHVLMIGHDPGMHETALALPGAGDPATLALLARKFPTAGLAVITFATASWSEIGPGMGTLVRFVTPKSLQPD